MLRTAGFFGGLDGADLCCAERDARALRRLLASSRGVIRRRDHAVLRRGNNLTRRAVDVFLAWAFQSDLDVLVFYVSGHGNRYGFALANGDFYTFAQLSEAFARLDARGTRVIAIFDTCEAGGLVDLFKAGEALEGLAPWALELSWLKLIASAGPGVRAYGAVTAARNAYEAPELGHGRFTSELLRALRTSRGTLRGGVGRFVSDVEAFATTSVSLLTKYGPRAAPDHVGGMDPIPLIASDAHAPFGNVSFRLTPGSGELDIQATVIGRRYLETRLRATYETGHGQIVQGFRDLVVPRDDVTVVRRVIGADLFRDAISASRHVRSVQWRVWAEDERGRSLGIATARPQASVRLVIPRGW